MSFPHGGEVPDTAGPSLTGAGGQTGRCRRERLRGVGKHTPTVACVNPASRKPEGVRFPPLNPAIGAGSGVLIAGF